MAGPEEIKRRLERSIKAVELRPSVGQGTAATTTRVRPGGLACDIEDGGWKLVADEGPDLGGDGLGPDPGVFTRAGLGSCLAIGYVMWAAVLEVPLDSVEVTVETDYDARGLFGVDDTIAPGWSAVRYTAKISSPAPQERVRELVEHADRHSSVLDIIRRALPVSGELRVSAGERT
jgi:uncharacterized OsmC-like protein